MAYGVADLRDWSPSVPVDVMVSNTTLQWVPSHLDRVPLLVSRVRPRGWFAFQVPANFDELTHTIRRDLAAEPPYAEQTVHQSSPESHDAPTYLRALQPHVISVDVWETT